MLIVVLKFSGPEKNGGGVGGHGVPLHEYIRNTPSDPEVHA